MKRWGATPEEWKHFKRLAKVDLLPVVSNPHLELSPQSRMKGVGKTPSVLNHRNQVIGFKDWTDHQATVVNLDAWATNPDFGLCIQTRLVRGFDIDVPDKKLAKRIRLAWLEALGVDELPRRWRTDSGKELLAFKLEGDFSKRSFVVKEWIDETTGKTKRWIVEFLAMGQQFVACGTHPEGERYQWDDGLPDRFPTITAEQFEAAWAGVVEEFALEGSDRRGNRRDPTLLEDLDIADPVAEYLVESDWPTYDYERGMLYLDCPWKAGHSSDNGPTETAWMLAGTGKYRNGHFACRHAGCSGRTDQEFFSAVGYKLVAASEFEDLSDEPDPELDEAVAAYVALAPGASAKSKELKASLKLPLPGFNRDNSGRIETSLENIARALQAPQAVGCQIAYDTFRGELMYATSPGAWESMTDAYQVKLRARLHNLGFKDEPSKEKMRDALEWIGDENQFDSAIIWLEDVVPKWDGVPRIADFFHRYFKTENTPYTRACSDYLWTAMAARILKPGIKADMVPVIVGAQGTRKSSGIAALAPAPEFFSEFDLDGKDDDKARKMRGCLVGELAELRGLQTRDRESILAWIARRDEEWTPKFKEHKVRMPRRCVFLGSTNDDEFLDDPTGERRWLPMMVLRLVDVAAIELDRDQLWAEARDVFKFDGGVAYEKAERLARAEHHKFKVEDEWLPRIARWLDDPIDDDDTITPRTSGKLQANEVLLGCIGLPKTSKRDQMRVAGILRKLGMEKVLRRVTTTGQVVTKSGQKFTQKPVKVWVDASL